MFPDRPAVAGPLNDDFVAIDGHDDRASEVSPQDERCSLPLVAIIDRATVCQTVSGVCLFASVDQNDGFTVNYRIEAGLQAFQRTFAQELSRQFKVVQ